jgi:hypothetical protein
LKGSDFLENLGVFGRIIGLKDMIRYECVVAGLIWLRIWLLGEHL